MYKNSFQRLGTQARTHFYCLFICLLIYLLTFVALETEPRDKHQASCSTTELYPEAFLSYRRRPEPTRSAKTGEETTGYRTDQS